MPSKVQDADPMTRLLNGYAHLSAEAEAAVRDSTKSIVRKRGGQIIREGQVVAGVFVIEKGLIRSFYKKGGREVTMWFGYENTPFVCAASFLDNQPSRETIQCLEDCVFRYLPGEVLNDLYLQYPEVSAAGWKMTEMYYRLQEERILSFQTQSAEERYRALLATEPEVIRRVPLGYIASYLGITQETLSRIRSKVVF